MLISRRGFLGYAAGVSAIGLAGKSQLSHLSWETPKALSGCALVDVGLSCTLRESSAGYESALESAHVPCKRTSLESLLSSRIVILPAFVCADESELARVRAHLENGSMILLESGAAFLNSKEFDFNRRLIHSAFGLNLRDPIRLWESEASFGQSPYVDYWWPAVMKVRDFSRIIPVECRSDEIIAWFQAMPVAARRRVGKGTVVFLGSPLGPHLLAGDREASHWLAAFCSPC